MGYLPIEILSKLFFYEGTGWSLLLYLVHANALQGVQQYIAQPGFDPREILAETKQFNLVKGIYPKLSPFVWAQCAPSFEVAGVLLKCLDEHGLREKVTWKLLGETGIASFCRTANIRKCAESLRFQFHYHH